MNVHLFSGNLEWSVQIHIWRTLLLTGLTWKIPVGTGESLPRRTPALKLEVSQRCLLRGFRPLGRPAFSLNRGQKSHCPCSKPPEWWGGTRKCSSVYLVDSETEAQRAGLEGTRSHRRGKVWRSRTAMLARVLSGAAPGTPDSRKSARVCHLTVTSSTSPSQGFMLWWKRSPVPYGDIWNVISLAQNKARLRRKRQLAGFIVPLAPFMCF